MENEKRYLQIDENGYPIFWPLMWDKLDREAVGDCRGVTEEEWGSLNASSFHCPRWKGDKHIIVLSPLEEEFARQSILLPLVSDADVHLKETDYVVLKLYEDDLGLNQLSEEDKSKYQEIVRQRQGWRNEIAKATEATDAAIAAEKAEDEKRYAEL